MLTLYVQTGCQYCHRVLEVISKLGLQHEEKNIADEAIAAELIARGGKRQVPYLIDTGTEVALYESEDIVKYLEESYGGVPEKLTEVSLDVDSEFRS